MIVHSECEKQSAVLFSKFQMKLERRRSTLLRWLTKTETEIFGEEIPGHMTTGFRLATTPTNLYLNFPHKKIKNFMLNINPFLHLT